MRLGWMDTVRGAAVIGVIVMHAELEVVSTTGGALPAVHTLNEWLGPVRMPLLVFLSGLLVPRSLARGAGAHLQGKVVHILWPYLVWGLLDATHVLVDAGVRGDPLPWELVGQLFHDPHTYLWFLGYLFVFHVAVTPLPATARTIGVPLVFWAAGQVPVDTSADKFLTLFGWFLVGDLAARWLAGRVPARVARTTARFEVAPLAAVGRSSLVYYACHLLVLTYAVTVYAALGLTSPGLLWLAIIVTAVAVGAALDHGRRWRAVDALFTWPGPRVRPTSRPSPHLLVTRRRSNLSA